MLQVRGAWRVATSTNPNSMNKAARREYQARLGFQSSFRALSELCRERARAWP